MRKKNFHTSLKNNLVYEKNNPKTSCFLEQAQQRLLVLASLFILALIGIGWKLSQATLDQQHEETAGAFYQNIEHSRGDFIDRNGLLLATSLRTFSVYANPRVITNPQQTAKSLKQLFPELDEKKLAKKLSSKKGFVWISRHLTPTRHSKILRLGIPGVYVMKDQRRVYPYGALFSHVLGFTDIDHNGIAGLEKGLNDKLKKSKTAIRLSLDTRVQHILVEELQSAIQTFQAKGGNGILVHVKTGEILAMSSQPDFDPNYVQAAAPENFFNRNTAGLYEFGSILKIHNTAMILEKKIGTLQSVYDASTPLHVGRFRITDFKGKNRPLSVQEAFLFSSNIANAKMALDAGAQTQKKFLEMMGFFKPVSLELPEISSPLLPATWKETTVITASYGYGFSITATHLIQSVAAIVDGTKRDLTFLALKNTEDAPKGIRVLSKKTVDSMRFLMRMAVLEGQAKKANVENYEIGGKTGTANLRVKGRYVEKNNMVSFVGAFPMKDPQYVLLVTLDRPQPSKLTYGYATAGWTAAPLAANIMRRIAPLLGVLPSIDPAEQGDDQLLFHAHATTGSSERFEE